MTRYSIIPIILLLCFALAACQPAPTPVPPTPTPYPTPMSAFAAHAFPPVIPDKPQHQNAWLVTDCLGCHKDGIGEAPKLVHKDLPDLYLTANCRTCHVPEAATEVTPVLKK
ncbi:MAG: hypothetical protein M1570_17205 [Chloroflexi bacterium]|nr:hypothetical protein [Chloroflexota bacterium]